MISIFIFYITYIISLQKSQQPAFWFLDPKVFLSESPVQAPKHGVFL